MGGFLGVIYFGWGLAVPKEYGLGCIPKDDGPVEKELGELSHYQCRGSKSARAHQYSRDSIKFMLSCGMAPSAAGARSHISSIITYADQHVGEGTVLRNGPNRCWFCRFFILSPYRTFHISNFPNFPLASRYPKFPLNEAPTSQFFFDTCRPMLASLPMVDLFRIRAWKFCRLQESTIYLKRSAILLGFVSGMMKQL